MLKEKCDAEIWDRNMIEDQKMLSFVQVFAFRNFSSTLLEVSLVVIRKIRRTYIDAVEF